jgi:hypothetical protein
MSNPELAKNKNRLSVPKRIFLWGVLTLGLLVTLNHGATVASAEAPPLVAAPIAPEFGDVVVKTSSSPTGVAIIQAERNNAVAWGQESDLALLVWDQRLSKDGRLRFWASGNDVVSVPVDGGGGPGTAAKTEGRMLFSGPLAVGGLGLYGAAIQASPTENKVLLFEAYGNSHHQTEIYSTLSPIYWVGWAGLHGSYLYVVQEENGGRFLYRLTPTFPDLTQTNRDCYYSTNLLTDCMLRAIKHEPRVAVRTLDNIQGIFVTLGNPSPQNVQ